MSNHNGAGLCAEIKARLTLQEAARMAGCNDLPEKIGVKFCSPLRPDRNPSCAIYRDKASGCYVMRDYSRGESYDAISLYAALRGIGNDEAPRELGEKLGIVAGGGGKVKVAGGKVAAPEIDPPVPVLEEIVIEPKAAPVIEPGPDLIEQPGEPEAADFEAVRASRLLPEDNDGLELAHRLGVLRFGKVCGFRSWVVTDRTNRVAEARRLDGEPFPQAGPLTPRKAHTLKGSKKSWPAGLVTATNPERLKTTPFALVEGGPDLLAVFCILAGQPGDLPDVQPLAMLGSSQSIAADALAMLAGRGGVVLAHGDKAGREAAERWARQLAGAGCRVLVRHLPAGKDLNDVLVNRTPARLAGILHAAPWRPEWQEPADEYAPDQPLPALEEETFEPEAAPEARVAVPLLDFRERLPDDADTLLGNRFLCREGGALFVGPSGIGKSSASVQMDIAWSLGREAFGVRPPGPLRILQIQAENDSGDLHEMVEGVCRAMSMTATEAALCRENLLVWSEKAKTGEAFIAEVVVPLLERHRPDLLRIDPLLAYLGDDPTNTAPLARFCRNLLNPLLEKHRCGCILNHHTPKTTNRDTSGWRPSDWMYSGAGAAELTNWARAVLVIEPTSNPDAFRFIAAKRGKRIGWANDFGEAVYERTFCHSEGSIAWREASEEEIAGIRPASDRNTPDDDALMAHVPLQGAIAKDALMSKWNGMRLGEKKCRGKLAELLDAKRLFVWQKKRPGVRPELLISRHEETML